MAKILIEGRLGSVKEVSGGFLNVGIAETGESYKAKDATEYTTPWFNLLVKADSPTGKFLATNAGKIDIISIEGNERQVTKDGKTDYYHTVINSKVLSWKKGDKKEEPETTGPSVNDEQVGDDELPY